MEIKLNSISDAKDFVNICSKYYDSEIDVKQERHIVDGKSILGIFSLNLLEPIRVVITSENENSKMVFYDNIEKWKVKSGSNLGDLGYCFKIGV